METITAIKTTLANIAPRIVGIESDWWIIGGAALALRGVDVGETHDIDILTDRDGSEEFKAALSDIRENTPKTKEDHLFRSSSQDFMAANLILK